MRFARCLLLLALTSSTGLAAIVHAFADELPSPAPARVTSSSKPVRRGAAAFRHAASAKGEAAEIAVPPAALGEERWYGWSVQLPPDSEVRGRSVLLMRLDGGSAPPPLPASCPVASLALEITSEGKALFHLHVPEENGAGAKCQTFALAPDVAAARGQWFDFVLHARWTPGADGFVELWTKQHDNNFFQRVDYRGPTWAGRERGPEFRIGAQVTARGEPEGKLEAIVWTDELRVADASGGFDDVAPPGAAARAAEARRGAVHYTLYPSELNQRRIPVMVYTPPGYADGTKRYPVIYNLHGAGGGSPERQWDRMNATLTRAMDAGEVAPTIYVFVNGMGDTGYIDLPSPAAPKVYSSIVTELIPHIDRHYRTIAHRGARGLDGFSMGGGGSLMLATKRPDLFSAVTAYAGGFIPHNPDDTNEVRRKLSSEFSQYALVQRQTDEIRAHLHIRMVCGDQDNLHEPNLKFKAFLEAQRIPVSWVSIPGLGHQTKELFDRVGIEGIRFMQDAFARESARK